MADSLSQPLQLAIAQGVIDAQIILEIEGVDTVYGAQIITKRIKIGDEGLVIGDSWRVGGLNEVEDQSDLISWKDGTTTSIRQTLNQDKGLGSSISSMQICLIDKDQEATRLVSPGVIVEDILGRKAKVYYGVKGDTAFPEDYLVIFRGLIDDVKTRQGTVLLNIAHPDQKKRQEIFSGDDTFTLTDAIGDSDTLFAVDEIDNAISSQDDLSVYLKIDDEYMKITSTNEGLALTVVRGQLGSVAAAHADGAEGSLVYQLTGNVMELALKLMLSGGSTYYAEDIVASSINYINPDLTIDNTIYFNGVDLVQKYGVTAGDSIFLTVPPASDNFGVGLATITDVNTTDYLGTVITLNETLVTETITEATVNFKSQWALLPLGLGMTPDECDIAEHERLKRLFLSSFEVDIVVTESTNGREFIEQELYAVASCYSVPRKARSSVGILSAPIPGSEIKTLSADNITNAKDLVTRRCLANNFYNEIVYKYDWDLEDDEPTRGLVIRDEDSINRIKSGKKTLVIESKGLRQTLNGGNLAQQAAQRRLNRYKLAAEEIEQVKVLPGFGFNIEIGDLVILDGSGVNLVNTADGNRSPKPRLFEVTNKTLNIATGEIILKLIDTSFDTSARYGLISPASYIKTGLSTSSFIIEESFSSIYGANEYLKWTPWVTRDQQAVVKVRNSDFSVVGTAVIDSINGNKITLATPLAFTPSAGYVMELANYNNANTTDQIKLVFSFLSDDDNDFSDGKPPFEFI